MFSALRRMHARLPGLAGGCGDDVRFQLHFQYTFGHYGFTRQHCSLRRKILVEDHPQSSSGLHFFASLVYL